MCICLDHPASRFLECTKDAFLIQHQVEPTRHRIGQHSNTLDLVFTFDEYAIKEITISAGVGKSDHCTLIFYMKVGGLLNANDRDSKYLYDKADYFAMNAKLCDIDWSSEFSTRSVEESWTFFTSKLLEVFDCYTPKAKRKKTVNQRRKPWTNNKALELIREKHRQNRKWREKLSAKHCNKYSLVEIEEQRLCYTRASNQSRWYCRKAGSQFESYSFSS